MLNGINIRRLKPDGNQNQLFIIVVVFIQRYKMQDYRALAKM